MRNMNGRKTTYEGGVEFTRAGGFGWVLTKNFFLKAEVEVNLECEGHQLWLMGFVSKEAVDDLETFFRTVVGNQQRHPLSSTARQAAMRLRVEAALQLCFVFSSLRRRKKASPCC